MEQLLDNVSIFILPPLISLIVGLTLAGLSLVKGRITKESILFALLCIWWSLLAPVFISHFFLRGNIDAIMHIERTVHLFYVFIPVINLIYFYQILEIRHRVLIWVFLALSTGLAVLSQTDYYITGLYKYPWGYIAKGGIALQFFGLYSMFGVIYLVVMFIRKFRREHNEIRRLKIKYILLSFLVVMFLTFMNLPAMNGINIYPMGNFMFVPLAVLAYGVMKHRLMDVRSVLYQTLMWAILSSLILVPNILIFIFAKPWYSKLNEPLRFVLLMLLFAANYFYIRRVQPRIDQLFNRRKYDLYRIEAEFISNISLLKSLESLIDEFRRVLKKTLNFEKVDVLIRVNEEGKYRSSAGEFYHIHPDIIEWFRGADHLVEYDMVSTNPYYDQIRALLLDFFEDLECSFIFPLVQNDELLGVICLSEKKNYSQLTGHEINFINNIRSTLAISLANSLMYEDLTDLKNNLEDKVLSRTEELMSALEKLEEAHHTAELDLAMAANVQQSMLPEDTPTVKGWDLACWFKPMSGVSGDTYDFYVNGDRLEGCALFDVSGHGIASGLITILARSIFRRYFSEGRDHRLCEVIEKANGELIEEMGDTDNYLSGVILRMVTEYVEYVNAGHPDIIIRRKSSGKVSTVVAEEEDTKGYFLGAPVMDSMYKTLKFKMHEGDALLLYTDCLIEAANDRGESFGEERVWKAMAEAPERGAGEILHHIVRKLERFTGKGEHSDDLTIILLQRQ
jgi:serine phosphatase RsbU (regulator of sigma subunit)